MLGLKRDGEGSGALGSGIDSRHLCGELQRIVYVLQRVDDPVVAKNETDIL
jgi:hypothetical protein